jgi:AraC-like DNA-binding protein
MVCLDEAGRGRRAVRLIAAPANLAPWVEFFWIQVRRGAEQRPWRVLPDSCSHVIFSLSDGVPRFALVGSRTSFCDIDVSRRSITVGARLRPGSVMHLARCAADTLTDGSFPMEAVFGLCGRELAARMAEVSPRAALCELAGFLSARLLRCEPDLRIEAALRSASSVDVAAAMLNVSLRTMRTRALQVTGLGPKRILRIHRLYRALQYGTGSRPAWSDVACRAGFADQAHMVREFQSLLGNSPEQWRLRAAADSFNTPRGALS